MRMQREVPRKNNRKQVITIQTTVPTTLEAFFRGQLRWLQEQGFEVHTVSSLGEALSTFAERKGIKSSRHRNKLENHAPCSERSGDGSTDRRDMAPIKSPALRSFDAVKDQ